QKLLGNINWVRPYLGLTMAQLAPLFEILKGNPDLTSPRSLTPETLKSIEHVEWAITNTQVCRVEPRTPITLFITVAELHPTGIIGQRNSQWADPLHIL
ncbi:POK18 protein, partial [Galbula dea]|nr:POK18 protein [Galbula dea]